MPEHGYILGENFRFLAQKDWQCHPREQDFAVIHSTLFMQRGYRTGHDGRKYVLPEPVILKINNFHLLMVYSAAYHISLLWVSKNRRHFLIYGDQSMPEGDFEPYTLYIFDKLLYLNPKHSNLSKDIWGQGVISPDGNKMALALKDEDSDTWDLVINGQVIDSRKGFDKNGEWAEDSQHFKCGRIP